MWASEKPITAPRPACATHAVVRYHTFGGVMILSEESKYPKHGNILQHNRQPLAAHIRNMQDASGYVIMRKQKRSDAEREP
jgi:hypothetical protein